MADTILRKAAKPIPLRWSSIWKTWNLWNMWGNITGMAKIPITAKMVSVNSFDLFSNRGLVLSTIKYGLFEI